MIFEPKPLSKEQSIHIITSQRFKNKSGNISCGHDFWEQTKKMEFGDIILCTRCGQYFAKIKHMPWITIKKEWLGPKILGYGKYHLTDSFFTSINVRVTD